MILCKNPTEGKHVGRIDDPFDAAKDAYPENEENVVGELALRIAGHFIPPLAVFNELRGHFSGRSTNERFKALVDAVNEKIEDLRRVNEQNILDIQSRIGSPEFTSAFREAAIQALLATDNQRI